MRESKILEGKRFLLWAGVVMMFFHVGLAALIISSVDLKRLGRIGTWLDSYAYFTISNGTYAFFAPGIGPGVRVRFLFQEPGKLPRWFDLEHKMNREVALRISNQFRLILDTLDDERVRHALASSWASYFFGRFAHAKSIRVDLEVFDVPSQAEFRMGKTGAWRSIYQIEFSATDRKRQTT